MKFSKVLFLSALAFVLIASVHHKVTIKPAKVVNHTLTIQQKAEHRIKVVDEGQCTATAVAPHAILTAVHCNEHDSNLVTFDMSVNKVKILSKTLDGRDHVIYIVDGPPFTNYVVLTPGDKPVSENETVYIYGAGGGAYPPVRKEGHRTFFVQDPSEIDAREGFAYYTLQVIPGDSGSAIYRQDGTVVGVITYKIGYPKDGNWESEDDADVLTLSGGFDINFTAAQLTAVSVGQGDEPLGKEKPTPRPRSIFDLF